MCDFTVKSLAGNSNSGKDSVTISANFTMGFSKMSTLVSSWATCCDNLEKFFPQTDKHWKDMGHWRCALPFFFLSPRLYALRIFQDFYKRCRQSPGEEVAFAARRVLLCDYGKKKSRGVIRILLCLNWVSGFQDQHKILTLALALPVWFLIRETWEHFSLKSSPVKLSRK